VVAMQHLSSSKDRIHDDTDAILFAASKASDHSQSESPT
jgi:hypothetical protein